MHMIITVYVYMYVGQPMMHTFDALLMMYCDLPARMNAGVSLDMSGYTSLVDIQCNIIT